MPKTILTPLIETSFQIDQDIQTKPEELINQDVDLDKPGFAQFYCIHCAKYFIDDTAMQAHFKTKVLFRDYSLPELAYLIQLIPTVGP